MAMALAISTESSSAPYRGDALFLGCSSPLNKGSYNYLCRQNMVNGISEQLKF
jgi:hypothetical protein